MPIKKVMVAFGTRPEAIKMAPVIQELRELPDVETIVLVTAQHREMLDQVLDLFGIRPDHDLDLMRTNQDLAGVFARILAAVSEVISTRAPDLLVVHGDTTTALAAAMAGFYCRVPVAHVEAGLRTGDLGAPWPEEMNRRLVSPLAKLHFAPTPRARDNLLAENIAARTIHLTGNTVVDALLQSVDRLESDVALSASVDATLPVQRGSGRIVLVTGHRRESFGDGFIDICHALRKIAQINDVNIVYPVHLNPNVQVPVRRELSGLPNVHLIPPLGYLAFVQLMRSADLILTDSGGIQEEAPSLGKPVLVMRDTSERPEAIAAGTAKLVGTDPLRIYDAAHELLHSSRAYSTMANARNPYGDGHASRRIVAVIRDYLQQAQSTSGRAMHKS